jgi:hypothetical protein
LDYTVDDFDLFIQELCVLILKLYVNHCKSTLKNVFTVIRFMSGLRQILQCIKDFIYFFYHMINNNL